jgi:DNA-binding transcriptional regulator LsrR (DeoR family)
MRIPVGAHRALVSATMASSPVEMVRKVARSSGGSAHALFTPMVVADARIAESLRTQPDVAEVLSRLEHLSAAALALGSWAPPESQLRETLPAKDRRELEGQGVVAEVGATLINDAGAEVAGDFSARCIAITSDQLRRVGRVVLVAGGERKARAALAVSKTGFVAEMITDRALAEALLDGQPV